MRASYQAAFFLLIILVCSGCRSLDFIRYGLDGKDVVQLAVFGSEEADFNHLDKITLKGFSISDFNHPQVKKYLRLYTTSQKKEIIAILKRGAKYIPTIKKIFAEKGIPQDLIYLPIIESGYRAHARSYVGAQGIWQFMYNTGRYYKLDRSDWHDDRSDPFRSTEAAAYHFKYLYKQFDNWLLVLAAYNAGSGKISRAIKMHKTRNFWEMCKYRYLKPETKNYVPKFIAASLIAKNPEKYGLPPLDQDAYVELASHHVQDATDIQLLAKCAGISDRDFRNYNPALRGWMTPPKKKFLVHVPVVQLEQFKAGLADIKPEDRITYRRHYVRMGENLTMIAQKYQISMNAIAEINGFKSKNSIRAGEPIVIPLRGLKQADSLDRRFAAKKKETVVNPTQEYVFLHEVGENEFMWDICRKYNIGIYQVKRWNKLKSNNLRAGKLLLIRKPVVNEGGLNDEPSR